MEMTPGCLQAGQMFLFNKVLYFISFKYTWAVTQTTSFTLGKHKDDLGWSTSSAGKGGERGGQSHPGERWSLYDFV